MQRGYRYQLSAPRGGEFADGFVPDLAPAEMLELGVFGGKYLCDCRSEFPTEWFANARLSPSGADPSQNHFGVLAGQPQAERSEEHTSALQSLMRISYAVFCLKKKKKTRSHNSSNTKEPTH